MTYFVIYIYIYMYDALTSKKKHLFARQVLFSVCSAYIILYIYIYQVFLKQVVLPAAAVIAFGAVLPLLAQGPGVARLLQVCACMRARKP